MTYAPRVEKMLRSSRSPKFLDVNVTEYRSDGTECSGCWGVDEAVDEGEGEGESDEDLDLLRSMVLLNEVRNRLNRLPLILYFGISQNKDKQFHNIFKFSTGNISYCTSNCIVLKKIIIPRKTKTDLLKLETCAI